MSDNENLFIHPPPRVSGKNTLKVTGPFIKQMAFDISSFSLGDSRIAFL